MLSRKLVFSYALSSFGLGLVTFYVLTRLAERRHLRHLRQSHRIKSLVLISQEEEGKDVMGGGNGGGGGGSLHIFFLRIWYCLHLYVIGVKWGIIEIFTKHRKLNLKELPRRPGDVVVITGGARGIGASVVKMLLQTHMHVIIGCRTPSSGTELVNEIRRQGIIWGQAEVLELDLNSLTSARQFATQVLSKNIPIHILINNAGIMFCPYSQTPDFLESQFQVNYLGHFLITNLLLPRLKTSGTMERHARIINVSSCAHYGGHIDFDDLQMEKTYSRYNAYMRSKLFQVISSTDLNRRLEKVGAKVNALSCHPGMVRTDLYQHLGWFKALNFFVRLIFKTPEQGADVVAYASLSPDIEKEGGLFIANSAKWSPNRKVFESDLQDKLWEISAELIGDGIDDWSISLDHERVKVQSGSRSVKLNL